MDNCNEILDSSRSPRRSLEVCSTENFRRYESIVWFTVDSFNVGSVFWFDYLWPYLISLLFFKIHLQQQKSKKQNENRNQTG